LLVLVEVKFIGVECTPDAASVFMAIGMSIEAAAMATVTTDIITLVTMATMVYNGYGGDPGAAIGLGILGGVLGGIP
jgi:hypothetical protein